MKRDIVTFDPTNHNIVNFVKKQITKGSGAAWEPHEIFTMTSCDVDITDGGYAKVTIVGRPVITMNPQDITDRHTYFGVTPVDAADKLVPPDKLDFRGNTSYEALSTDVITFGSCRRRFDETQRSSLMADIRRIFDGNDDIWEPEELFYQISTVLTRCTKSGVIMLEIEAIRCTESLLSIPGDHPIFMGIKKRRPKKNKGKYVWNAGVRNYVSNDETVTKDLIDSIINRRQACKDLASMAKNIPVMKHSEFGDFLDSAMKIYADSHGGIEAMTYEWNRGKGVVLRFKNNEDLHGFEVMLNRKMVNDGSATFDWVREFVSFFGGKVETDGSLTGVDQWTRRPLGWVRDNVMYTITLPYPYTPDDLPTGSWHLKSLKKYDS